MPLFRPKTVEDVEAWRFDPAAPIPVWVARKCHYLGDGKFTANSAFGPLPVDPGDYIVRLSSRAETDTIVTVVTGSDFEANYDPIPES